MMLEIGSRVGEYLLAERLGAGAFGEVWKAAHAHLPRIVAIKFATSEAAAVALERQGVAQFGLDHPGIVRVLDANLSHAPPYVVLEHVPGKSLRQLLRERGRFEIQDVSAIFRQLAEAVAYAHERGVVHGDLKPENVLVQEDGVHKLVKVTDFQLGSYTAGRRPDVEAGGVRPSLRTGGPMGTYHYLAPEQEMGERIDGRADLYALGVVLFEMATGTLPQGRDLPSDLNPALSWWWDHIFSRCYTGRDRRYKDCKEMQEDLAAAATGPGWGEMPSQRGAEHQSRGEVRARIDEVLAMDVREADRWAVRTIVEGPQAQRERVVEATEQATEAFAGALDRVCAEPPFPSYGLAPGAWAALAQARAAGAAAVRPPRSPRGAKVAALAFLLPVLVTVSFALSAAFLGLLMDGVTTSCPPVRVAPSRRPFFAERDGVRQVEEHRRAYADARARYLGARSPVEREVYQARMTWLQQRANDLGFRLVPDTDGEIAALAMGR